jgi:hypothetical protein
MAHVDHPWVSPEVGRAPPEVGRGASTDKGVTDTPQNSTLIADGNDSTLCISNQAPSIHWYAALYHVLFLSLFICVREK